MRLSLMSMLTVIIKSLKCRFVLGDLARLNGSLSNIVYRLSVPFIFVLACVFVADAAIAKPMKRATATAQIDINELPRLWPTFSHKKKIRILEALLKKGRLDMFEALLAKTSFNHRGGRFEDVFYHGMLSKHRGKFKSAASSFRSLLADNPKLHRVRLELAHTLFLLKEDDSAKHHFELLSGSNANQQLGKVVSGYLDALKKRRKWSFSAYASMAPRGIKKHKSEYATIIIAGVPQRFKINTGPDKGIGANGGVNGGYRYVMSDRWDLMIGGGANGRKYKNKAYDEFNLSGEFGPRYNFTKGSIGLYATLGHSWFGGHHGKENIGGRLHATYRLGPKDIVTSDLSCHTKKYDFAVYLDGHRCAASSQLNHYFSSRSFVTVRGGLVQDTAESEHEAYNGGNGAVGLYYELPMGLTTHSQLTYEHRNYLADYPTAGKARRDDQIDATLSLTKRDWEIYGFAPKAQYTYTRNLSNIPFLDYDAHNFNLTLTKQF